MAVLTMAEQLPSQLQVGPWDLMTGGMILDEELSISFGNEEDHLLPQKTGHCVANILEFIE